MTANKILSKSYALRLIRQGRATKTADLVPDQRGRVYVAISRHDTQHTAHYLDHVER